MKYVLKVEGMMCEKCAARLTNVLTAQDTVKEAVVSLADKTAVVETESPAETVKAWIEEAGFDAELL